jgi:membrane protease YdiL (CAAX protease family)
VFLLPVWLFRRVSIGPAPKPMYHEKSMPRYAVFYLLAGVALIFAASYANSYLSEIFDVFSPHRHVGSDGATANYQFVLMILVSAVVPAFVEELFFRGAILTSLLPYGKGGAILFSAILFGVMHQSIDQLLYATVAGVVLGFLYVKTRSIWPCILLHFLNNVSSIFQTVLAERLGSAGEMALGIVTVCVFALGVISAVALLILDRDMLKFDTVSGDIAEIGEENEPIPPLRRMRLFFSAPMIIYFVIALGCAVLYRTVL